MDFLQRSAPNQTHSRANGHPAGAVAAGPHEKSGGFFRPPKWLRIASVVLLFSLTALMVSLVVLLTQGRIASEDNIIDKERYQAVFLSSDQVYFGRILDLNDKYVNLVDVYYLSAQQQESKDANLELVKLGCEVHGPSDQLVINRDQLVFWENVKTDSKLADGIKQWKEKNPDGLKCEETTQGNETQQQSPQETAGSTESKKNN